MILEKNNQNFPLVSIVTPSYNQGEYIEETIQSVLNQNYPNIEYIVIDGGSKDRSKEIIQKYADKISYWVSEPDNGQADAINKGWEMSTGEFIGWINSDDILTSTSVNEVVKTFLKNPALGLVYGDLERINELGEFIEYSSYSEFNLKEMVRKAGWISQPGSLIKKAVYEKVGELDASLHFQMDLDYWLKIGLNYPVEYLPYPVAKFRQHTLSKTNSSSHIAANDIIKIYSKFFSRKDLPAEYLLIKREAFSNAYIYSARAFMRSEKYWDALLSLKKSIFGYPQALTNTIIWKTVIEIIFIIFMGGYKSKRYKKYKVFMKNIRFKTKG
ncbi:MAG: glycosyltransferase [Bacteroidetes bacterium]|jgi:glycosyltransferase involved in cell wall biosynthesis|nr:glycosyltransferase [Chloroflexota bacterium]MBT6834775.1 glycosyltransferase [Bacteroidota bacterium]MBT4002502.1 glycosyltransferase [Chloroflexota bacterium]MBT4306211.1 glycosyltransferase [Chloroflexota bacterium]MBT4535000.1 glycosyltransferase [Chloroflexota bacterium]